MFIKNLLNKLPKKGTDKKYFLQLDEAPEAKPAASKVAAAAPAPAAKVETPAAPVAAEAVAPVAPAPAPAAATKKPKSSAKAKAPAAKVEAPAAPKAEPVVAKAPVKTVVTFADYSQIPSNQFGDRRLPGANMASFLELARQVKTPN